MWLEIVSSTGVCLLLTGYWGFKKSVFNKKLPFPPKSWWGIWIDKCWNYNTNTINRKKARQYDFLEASSLLGYCTQIFWNGEIVTSKWMDLIQDLEKKSKQHRKKPNKMDGKKKPTKVSDRPTEKYRETERNAGERSKQLLLESSFSWKVIQVALVETILTHWACL